MVDSWSEGGRGGDSEGDVGNVWVTRTPYLERGADHTKKGKRNCGRFPFGPVQVQTHLDRFSGNHTFIEP
jgi:hypothetical protein